MSATINGKMPRKQLADQIDRLEAQLNGQCARLDGIIDALAEGLPSAVAEACREGSRQAVKDVLIEVLTNPELRALLSPTAVPAAPPVPEPEPEPKKPSLWARLKAKIASVRESFKGTPEKVKAAVASPFQSVINAVDALGKMAGEALPLKRILWISGGVGLTVGVASLVMPHWAAATIGAVSTASTTAVVQVGMWLKRGLRYFGLAN